MSRYNPDKGDSRVSQFINYKENQGFTVNYAGYIIEDHEGFLWIAGNRDVFKFDPVAEANVNIPFSDYSIIIGLENEIVCCIAEDRDVMLWFGTSKGAVGFDAAKMQLANLL